jgi:glycosyltransferase involved in cell wall biosynthesis
MKLIHLTTVDLSLRALLLNQLERYAKEGFEVVGVSAPGPYVPEIEDRGIRHVPVESLTRSWTPMQDARALQDLRRIFRAEHPTIVHTHNPKTGVLGRVAARSTRVPVVVNTVHGLYAAADIGAAKRTVVRGAERVSARFSDHELFQSREDFDWALRTKLVPPGRATWLGNGVDTARFDRSAADPTRVAELRATWGAEGRVVIGTVGRLVAEKGYRELFRAAAVVRRTHPEALFVAVGPEDPSKADRLDPALLERVRAGHDVVLAGEGDGEDMPAVYAAFDVFCLPSYREGVPRSAIEAMSTGLPVVASDIRGCREVVADGVTGLLIPDRAHAAIARAVARLLADPGLREAMGAAGRARAVERFDEELVIERTLDVYDRLLRAKGLRT